MLWHALSSLTQHIADGQALIYLRRLNAVRSANEAPSRVALLLLVRPSAGNGQHQPENINIGQGKTTRFCQKGDMLVDVAQDITGGLQG